MRESRRPFEGACRPTETPVPAVLGRERGGLGGLRRGGPGEGAQALPVGRSRLDVAGQRGEGSAEGLVTNVVLVEELPHGLPERARLARGSLVADRLAHEHEPSPGPGARGREEVAVAARGIGPLEAGAAAVLEAPARVLVEERLHAGTARKRPLLEPEHEDRVEAARSGPQEVDDGDPARRARALARDGRAVECREHVASADLPACARERIELVERARDGVVRGEIRP